MINFAFFGTPDRAVIALQGLAKLGLVPKAVVTQPDRPQGRKLVLTAPPAKVWALAHGIPVLQPEKIDGAFIDELRAFSCELYVVVAYGKILPKSLLDAPRHGAINLHASLLPKYRGSSPIETTILHDDRDVGVSVIQMDEKMDHGPVLAQTHVETRAWPLHADDLALALVSEGSKLLAQVIEQIEKGETKPEIQDESKATYTKKISKEDGHIDLNADGYQNFLKFNAYFGWPGLFYFVTRDGKEVRVKITDAAYEQGKFVVRKIIPEGKKEMDFGAF